MKTLGRFLATVGLVVVVLDVAGALGIGNFVMYFGAKPVLCKAVKP